MVKFFVQHTLGIRLLRGFGLTCIFENVPSPGNVGHVGHLHSTINQGKNNHSINWLRAYNLLTPASVGSAKCKNLLYYSQSTTKRDNLVKVVNIDFINQKLYSTVDKPSNSEKHKTDDKEDEDEEKHMSLFQRFKLAYKQHGKTLIGVHVATSIVWYGSFYYIALSGFDIVSLMRQIGFSETLISPFTHKGLGEIAVAYLMYKLATPARYTVTLAGTNLAIRHFKKTGYIKEVEKEDSLRELLKEGTTKLKDKRDEVRGDLKEMRDDIKKKLSR